MSSKDCDRPDWIKREIDKVEEMNKHAALFPIPGSQGPSGPVPQSAFRAVNNTKRQAVTAEVLVVPVPYPNEVFDLNDEYTPEKSTFTPKQDGVYLVIAGVNFGSNIQTNYRMLIIIRVNGKPVVAENDFFGELPFSSRVTVSTILSLKAGDAVNVAFVSSTDGAIIANPLGTHFEAANFPSPT